LLFGETDSAVSVIIMNESLDEGDLIHQEKFSVSNTWSTPDFYQFAFTLIREKLPNVLADFATQKLVPQPQPLQSPTPIARRFTREDGYIPWDFLLQVLDEEKPTAHPSALLFELYEKLLNWPEVIEHAIRALSPWPGVWTLIPTDKGEKRMKILSAEIRQGKLQLNDVQIEGKEISQFTRLF
jgi:methionyl-tRNA formyltransferase